MTLEEAIEILGDEAGLGVRYSDDALDAATKLGIEALKRLAFNRLNTIASSDELLPGETKRSGK